LKRRLPAAADSSARRARWDATQEIKAGVDGRLISDYQVELKAAFGRLFFLRELHFWQNEPDLQEQLRSPGSETHP
jgi:hypothetical protein